MMDSDGFTMPTTSIRNALHFQCKQPVGLNRFTSTGVVCQWVANTTPGLATISMHSEMNNCSFNHLVKHAIVKIANYIPLFYLMQSFMHVIITTWPVATWTSLLTRGAWVWSGETIGNGKAISKQAFYYLLINGKLGCFLSEYIVVDISSTDGRVQIRYILIANTHYDVKWFQINIICPWIQYIYGIPVTTLNQVRFEYNIRTRESQITLFWQAQILAYNDRQSPDDHPPLAWDSSLGQPEISQPIVTSALTRGHSQENIVHTTYSSLIYCMETVALWFCKMAVTMFRFQCVHCATPTAINNPSKIWKAAELVRCHLT